jgi:hypothetical protein
MRVKIFFLRGDQEDTCTHERPVLRARPAPVAPTRIHGGRRAPLACGRDRR